MIYTIKKFKHDLDLVRDSSPSFSLPLHIELWLKDYLIKKSPLDAGFPWINYCVIQFLHSFIHPNMNVLEFGAGGSSIFFLKRDVNLITIEHEEIWINNVRKRISSSQKDRWTAKHISQSLPNHTIPFVNDYLTPLDHLKNDSIDIAFIDGRHRLESIKRSIPLIKNGGAIILDNSDRPQYSDAFGLLESWSLQNTSCITNGSEFFTPAAIWTKPSFA